MVLVATLIKHDHPDFIAKDVFDVVVPSLILLSVAALLISVTLGWVLRFKYGYKSRTHTLMTVLSVLVLLSLAGGILLTKLSHSLTSRPQEEPITVQTTPPAPSEPPSKIEIKVMADGTLFADDQQVTLKQLHPLFETIKENDGLVWYYRELSQDDPPAIATDVLDLIVAYELDITLSTKPDFSDAVSPAGVARPRPE